MYLMSKNAIIAQIDFDKMIFIVFNQNLMPFALRGNNVNLFTVRDWISDRALSINRANAKKILSALNINQNNRLAICYSCKGLSLTDCYWFRDENDTKSTWESVNLYENTLTNAVAAIALTGKYITIQGKIRTPEVTGQGAYAKCWRRINNKIFLYKTSSKQGNGIEHKIECLCSDILDKLEIEHVKYSESKINNVEVSRCENMTTTDLSICEIDYYESYCNRNNINMQAWLLKQKEYYEMLIADFILLNTDRHSGNWGIWFNSNTGDVIKLHPLYDHNNALEQSDDIMSKVIHGKTLEECAKFAKRHCNIEVTELEKWLRHRNTKQRFKNIFGGLDEYKMLLQRIETYKSM